MTKLTASDLDILARTIFGEARGESFEGKMAVAHVVINRVNRRHSDRWATIAQACLDYRQFSCWLEEDPNIALITDVDVNDPVFRECLLAGLSALAPRAHDPTHGATHYHARGITPRWAKGHTPIVTMGGHLFYTGIA